MKLNNENIKLISDELIFVVKKMDESEVPLKLYYFSAVSGIFHRILNINYDPDLVFAHFVLRSTFDTFQQRLNALKQGDATVPLSEEQFIKLTKLTKELAKTIKKGENIEKILKEFVVLAYSTTGNGYYLMQKGHLKI